VLCIDQSSSHENASQEQLAETELNTLVNFTCTYEHFLLASSLVLPALRAQWELVGAETSTEKFDSRELTI
jgi:hypothetical protein